MKKILISIVLFLIVGSNPTIIELNDYYCGKGAIFNKETHYPFKTDQFYTSITPSLNNVIVAENIIYSNYYDFEIKIAKTFNTDTLLINDKFKNPLNVKKKYKKYNRQYAGYINTKNDTIIYVGMLNFSNKKKAEKYFTDWDKTIFFGTGNFYSSNWISYEVNLKTKKIIN